MEKQKLRMLGRCADAVLNQNDICHALSEIGCGKHREHICVPAGWMQGCQRTFSACLKR